MQIEKYHLTELAHRLHRRFFHIEKQVKQQTLIQQRTLRRQESLRRCDPFFRLFSKNTAKQSSKKKPPLQSILSVAPPRSGGASDSDSEEEHVPMQSIVMQRSSFAGSMRLRSTMSRPKQLTAAKSMKLGAQLLLGNAPAAALQVRRYWSARPMFSASIRLLF